MITKGRKIGRNESCPCDSGKKFKQCCEKKGITHLPEEEVKSTHPLSVFNLDFVLTQISNAFIIHENHGKNIRLEEVVLDSFQHADKSAGIRDVHRFKRVLDDNYSFHHYEDPPEHLFSDIITFFGGDYITFPGIFPNGHFVLSNLLMTIFFSENNISDEVKSIIHSRALLLLNISNEIAKKSGISRFEKGIEEESNLIILNNSTEDFTFLDYDTVESWCRHFKLDHRQIFNFVLSGDEKFDEKDPDKNPVIIKPLKHVHGGFRVLSPTSIAGALLHSILVELIDNKCLDHVINRYADLVWYQCVESHIRKMNVSPITIDLLIDTKQVKYGAYKIDTDKIMIVILNQDDGENYFKEGIHTASNGIEDTKDITKQCVELLKTVFPGNDFFFVYLTSGIGRPYGVTYDKSNYLSIAMSVVDFNLIMRLRDYDSLFLWNYAQAKKTLLNTTKLSPFTDEMDIFSLYHNKGNCFYFGDDEKPNYIAISPGTALSLREEIYVNEDIHSILFINDDDILGSLVCVKVPEYDRTYHPLDSQVLQQVVKGDRHPIWVRFAGDIFEIPAQNRDVYIKMLQAISYWIWQIVESLEDHLSEMPEVPLTVIFDFRNRTEFEQMQNGLKAAVDIENDFGIKLNNNRIFITIPETINSHFFSNNNSGEQHLVRSILRGFAMLQESQLGKKTLEDTVIDQIIERHAPLGIKKKIFLMETRNDVTLYPTQNTEPRYIQEYHTNVILDELVPRLIKLNIISGQPEVVIDQDGFLKKMLFNVLLPWLNQELSQFDSVSTIEYLLKQAETLVYSRRTYLFTLPTSIACFSNYQKQVEKLMKVEKDSARVSSSVRCLIEHISAFSPNKGKIPSQSELDLLVAIMEQIIAWGMANDHIFYGLTDTHVDILPSGRIGTDHTIESEVFLPFQESHAKKSINDSSVAFDRAYEIRNTSDDADKNVENIEFDKLDHAFSIDYGISLTRVLEFSKLLIIFAFQQEENSFCKMNEIELKEKTMNAFGDLSDEEFNSLLSYYSLSKRKSFFKVPPGFENHDISPWRFNRGLSLLRKPMIKIEEPDTDPYYIWGPRLVELASDQILSLCYSGKLRCKEDGALSKLKGEILEKKGSKFTNMVFDFFTSELTNIILDKEVRIKPGSKLNSIKDLGDIDVLIISSELKKIFLIECKNTALSKTVKEMAEEVENLFGSESKKGWIVKHEERFDWVKNNIGLLSEKYSIDLADYEVHAAVLSSEQLPTKYLKKASLPFPIVSFFDVKDQSLKALLN